eukprot:EG_transcript_16918
MNPSPPDDYSILSFEEQPRVSRSRTWLLNVAAALVVLFIGFALGRLQTSASQSPSDAPQDVSSIKHLLLIGCDGLGGLNYESVSPPPPVLSSMMTEGAATLRARNQLPTLSQPNWATLLTGQVPVQTGIFSNDWDPSVDLFPGDPSKTSITPAAGEGQLPAPLWKVARDHMAAEGKPFVTAASISWNKLQLLMGSSPVDHLFMGDGNDTAVLNAMEEAIRRHQPDFMFVHFDGIDHAGHAHHWNSEEYNQAVAQVDAYIGRLLRALEDAGILGSTLVTIVGDHGGDTNHGQSSPICIHVPVIAWGAGVTRGLSLDSKFISNADVAPTLLHGIGVQGSARHQNRLQNLT